MKNSVLLLLLALLAAAAAACNNQPAAPATPAAVTGNGSVAAPNAAPAPAAAPSGTLSGPVLETMDSGGYTYMKLKTLDGETWVATPQTKVAKGQLVTVSAQMTAEKFQSSTLNRTFDRIVFATLVSPDAAPQSASAPASAPATGKMPGGMPGNMTSAMGTPADHMKPKVDIGDVNVPKAEGAESRTVAEVWGGRAALSGKEVVVRGKVVKFLGGIMGTNFMHVRDGSGSQEKGDNDLTVTTDQMASVGDVVTIRGNVIVDKDFGAGYRYPVLVEKAKIAK